MSELMLCQFYFPVFIIFLFFFLKQNLQNGSKKVKTLFPFILIIVNYPFFVLLRWTIHLTSKCDWTIRIRPSVVRWTFQITF